MSSCNFLKEPLNVRDLLDKGCEFTIDESDANFTNDNDDVNDGDIEEENSPSIEKIISSRTQPFDQLREQMVKINPYMYKRINKQGNTEKPLVPLNARAHICYSAFWEGETVPFDSSYLRERPYTFITGTHTVLEGLEIAVSTMHIGEEAEFIISYHLLFHEIGCPPRIKPKADGLFVIELEKYEVFGDLHEELQISEGQCYKFAAIVEKVKNIHLRGVNAFRHGNFRFASQAFGKAVHLLTVCDIADDCEESEQKKLLILLYTNMAVTYNKLDEPKKACEACKQLRLLTDRPSCKAIFQEARALLLLGEYRKSRQLLVQAQHLEPNNKFINDELQILEESYRRHKESETSICRRAFGISKNNDNDRESNVKEKETEFNSSMEREILELFNAFKLNEKQNTLVLPAGLTAEEAANLKKVSEKLDLKMFLNPVNNKTYIIEKSIKS